MVMQSFGLPCLAMGTANDFEREHALFITPADALDDDDDGYPKIWEDAYGLHGAADPASLLPAWETETIFPTGFLLHGKFRAHSRRTERFYQLDGGEFRYEVFVGESLDCLIPALELRGQLQGGDLFGEFTPQSRVDAGTLYDYTVTQHHQALDFEALATPFFGMGVQRIRPDK